MLNNKTVAVVVPAYNEEKQIGRVIKTMPKFVDRIVIINDCSRDNTAAVIKKHINGDGALLKQTPIKSAVKKSAYNRAEEVVQMLKDKEANLFTPSEIISKPKSRVVLINHLKNGQIGAAVASGYKWCADNNIGCIAVMDGDGQMDPDELINICRPVVMGDVDFVKANRLKHRSAFFVIPKVRFFGNSVLSLLTKIASGYWRVSDTQTGFTAISLGALKAIRIHNIYHSYGYPNDMLVKLNIAFCTIREVESKPVYNIGEKSKMKELKVIPRISWLLFKSFWKRLYVKYLFRDFHPLFLFYHFAFFLMIANIPYLIEVIKSLSPQYTLPTQYLLIFMLLSVGGFQSLFFAMWMDMMDNERLYK